MKSITEKTVDHPFFREMASGGLARVAGTGGFAGAAEKEHAPDQPIFLQGEEARYFYLIDAGEVALETVVPGPRTIRLQETAIQRYTSSSIPRSNPD